jgi:hypothetical protein
MKFNFRQGIVRPDNDHNPSPKILERNRQFRTIDLKLSNEDCVTITAAHKGSNYLFREEVSVFKAWGPFSWSRSWGPEPENLNYFLFWDVNLSNGEVTRGYTHSAAISSYTEPAQKVVGTHWFDLTEILMKVYDGAYWLPVCRVFAGVYSPTAISNNLIEYSYGSQVGILSQENEFSAGFIVVGQDKKAIVLSNGELMTSETDVILQGGYNQPVQIEHLSASAIAIEPIPAYFCVSLAGEGKVKLASSTDISKKPIGICVRDTMPGESLSIITEGIVFNDLWEWDLSLSDSVYCGPTGELLQHETGIASYKMGMILTSNSVIIDRETIEYFGPTGPIGPMGPTGPAGGPTGPIGPTGPSPISLTEVDQVSPGRDVTIPPQISGAKAIKWIVVVEAVDGRIEQCEISSHLKNSIPYFTRYAILGDRINTKMIVDGSLNLVITNQENCELSITVSRLPTARS